jgi:hypothetical protein
MPTDAGLTKNINRLIELCRFSSKGADSVTIRTAEYTRLLRAGAKDDKAVSQIVSDLIEHASDIPTAAEMVEAIQRHNASKVQSEVLQSQQAPLGCAECHGSGFTAIERVKRHGMFAGAVYSYADFCPCSLGKWKRECEQSRKAEAAAKKLRTSR